VPAPGAALLTTSDALRLAMPLRTVRGSSCRSAASSATVITILPSRPGAVLTIPPAIPISGLPACVPDCQLRSLRESDMLLLSMPIGIVEDIVVGDPLSWNEVSKLVNEVGNEKWLGQRIQTERKTRRWSQARLSTEMAKVGHPLHQSAISKIEPPDEDRRGGHPKGRSVTRSVTIGEAVGFSKVFGIPLGELLLPPDAVRNASAWQGYVNAVELKNKAQHCTREYENALERIRPIFRTDALLALRLLQHQSAVTDAHEKDLRTTAAPHGEEPSWDPETREAHRTPAALTVIDDILRPEEKS
jgi:hypothetical protein